MEKEIKEEEHWNLHLDECVQPVPNYNTHGNVYLRQTVPPTPNERYRVHKEATVQTKWTLPFA